MSYSVGEVSAMLGLSPSQIRAYASKGFLEPQRGARGELRFGFHDLVILRTAGELAAARIPKRKVKRVLERLREQLPDDRSLTGVRITASGDQVIVRDGDTVWNPESGQALFDFPISDLSEKAAPFALRTKPVDELTADEWYELACEVEMTSPEDAKDAYERVLRADPRHADAHVNLGRLHHEEGAPAAAEKHYRAALEADPHHETAAFNLGVALEDLGRMDDALKAYLRAIAIDEENADAHYNVAGIYEKQGDKQAALRHLKVYRVLQS
jgi:tetratricopeptide (TPR) repeat protein